MTLLAVTTACSRSPTAPEGRTPVEISVTGPAPALGESVRFTATAIYSDGKTDDVTTQAVWQSFRPEVAIVTETGLVTAASVGAVDITATFEAVRGNARVRIAEPSPPPLTPFMRDYIEALFLGSGPLSTTGWGEPSCPQAGRWSRFRDQAQVQLVISTTTSEAGRSALVTAAASVSTALNGHLAISVDSTDDPVPLPAAGQVTVTAVESPYNLVRCPGPCAIPSLGPLAVLISSRLILSAPSAIIPTHPNGYVHEFGHGVLGFCHVDGNRIGGPELSIMSSGCCFSVRHQAAQPSPFDMAAMEAVYASHLAIGAIRDDFVLAGLVNPLPTAATSSDRMR